MMYISFLCLHIILRNCIQDIYVIVLPLIMKSLCVVVVGDLYVLCIAVECWWFGQLR